MLGVVIKGDVVLEAEAGASPAELEAGEYTGVHKVGGHQMAHAEAHA
jgi:hypothetical protein